MKGNFTAVAVHLVASDCRGKQAYFWVSNARIPVAAAQG